jgi:hypothetical protein
MLNILKRNFSVVLKNIYPYFTLPLKHKTAFDNNAASSGIQGFL